MIRWRSHLATGLVALATAACASSPTDPTHAAANGAPPVQAVAASPQPAAPPAPTPQQIGERSLGEGIALYDKGDFNGAIRVLQGTPEIWSTGVETRVQAYKYVAFSQCLSNRRPPCRNAFDEILKLNPQFELSAAESGHPMWGPVFKQAKRDARQAGKEHRATGSVTRSAPVAASTHSTPRQSGKD